MTNKKPANWIAWTLDKYGTLLLRFNKRESARKVYQTLNQRRPNSFVGFFGLAKVAAHTGDMEAELKVWQRLIQIAPDNRAAQGKYAELLRLTSRADEAEAYYHELEQTSPRAQWILSGLARTAAVARNYDLAVTRWQELATLYPSEIRNQKGLIRALIEVLDFEQAQSIYDQYLTEKSDISYLLLQIEMYLAQSDVEKAYDALDALDSKFPGDTRIINRKLNVLTNLYRTTGDISYAQKSLAVLDQFERSNSVNSRFLERRIDINILLSKNTEALALISKLSEDRTQKNMELRAWASYIQGDIEGSKALWKDITRLYFPIRVRPPPPDSLQRTDSHSTAHNKDSILLFTVVRNERWRLQWFLDYYRSMGVERFFFVDNDSSDGTAEFLHKQPDVHVFWTEQSYAKAYSGMQWVNWLVEQYGADCWCIYADVDEALVFPGVEQRGLRSLTTYMSDHGQEAMYAFMLDMYAPHLNSIRRDNDYTDFLNDYPLFENEYSWLNTACCPYVFTAGGIRRTFKLSENQTKTPLIRGGRGIKFLMSSHLITPAHLSDVSAVLLHYKLAGDFKENFANDLVENTRIARCKMRHWRYIEALKGLSEDDSFVHDNTVSYQSSQQLVELGILKTSPNFEAASHDRI